MATIIPNSLSDDHIDYIINLPEVITAKETIDKQSEGKVSFIVNLPSAIKSYLNEKLDLDLTNVDSIPMRWIKGDTKPHIDRGTQSFEKTYLIYLTDSVGEFIVDNNSYSITKGDGYIFSEGLNHETVSTGSEPRLLFGPMSEQGFAVGEGYATIYANGETDTIYIRYNSGSNQYQVNNDGWQQLFLPVVIQNTNLDPTNNILKFIFTTDITLVNSTDYFICDSDGIQFGSTSLNNDGSRPKIYIEDVDNYTGLINNGNIGSSGSNNIYVYNLEVLSIGSTTLAEDFGWIGQSYFGREAIDNYIVNCFSNGDIPIGGGGIVSKFAGYGNGTASSSSLYIIGCSSHGNIGENGGGIVGYNAAADGGYVKCEQCWSTGIISGNSAGGIFGQYAASGDGGFGGEAVAEKCYSIGAISGNNAGGIFGQLAGTNAFTFAENCYSQGAMSGTNAGGIYGNGAASDGGTSVALNCYSSEIETAGNGIFSGNAGGSRVQNFCYIANGIWSDSAANVALVDVPSPVVGTVWVNQTPGTPNTPYSLNEMGYTPYTIENIVFVSGAPILNQSYIQTISAGQSSIGAIRVGYSYDILKISGGDPASYGTITIDDSTGVITTTNDTLPGTYTITLRNTGSYNITTFGLTISGGTSPSGTPLVFSIPPCCQPICPQFNQTTNNTQQEVTTKKSAIAIASDVDSTYLAINQDRAVNFVVPAFKSYRDYMIYLQSKYR